MGSYSAVCSITKMPINEGSKVMYIPLAGNELKTGVPQSNAVYYQGLRKGLFFPAFLPIEGEYDGCGKITNIVKNENTRFIEDKFGIGIDDFIEIISESETDEYRNKPLMRCLKLDGATGQRDIAKLSSTLVHEHAYERFGQIDKHGNSVIHHNGRLVAELQEYIGSDDICLCLNDFEAFQNLGKVVQNYGNSFIYNNELTRSFSIFSSFLESSQAANCVLAPSFSGLEDGFELKMQQVLQEVSGEVFLGLNDALKEEIGYNRI